MREPIESTEVGKRYAEAHVAHHRAGDLCGALDLYATIIATDPDTQEAGYSRSQVANMVNTVVSKEDLFDAQVALLSARFARERADAAAAPAAP